MKVRARASDSAQARIENSIEVDDAGCWNWMKYRNREGYGRIKLKNATSRLAHRVSYSVFVGPIPEGLTIDHLCRNRACVNPAHLEAVTTGVNTLRGETMPAINARKTHCPQGHPFDAANTCTERLRSGSLGRRCRTCKLESAAAYRLRIAKGGN